MPADDPDLAAFASSIQGMAAEGGFDPFAMLSGAMPFHSVFIAPFTPSLSAAIARFLADGGGPLAGTPQALVRQGLAEADAQERARSMFRSAQGMCVVVLGGEHGLGTIPQLFFGTLAEDWRRHAVESCGRDFAGAEALARALADLAAKAGAGTRWPALIAGPGAGSNVLGYYLELAHGLAETQEGGLLPTGGERLADLGHWIGGAVALLSGSGQTFEAEDAVAVARCHLAAGAWAEACPYIEHADRTGLEAEELIELIGAWTDAAVRGGGGRAAAAWLWPRIPAFEGRIGRCYDLVRALLRLQASGQAPAEALIATCELLRARDRKSFRHDLGREPLWAVRLEDPGELLDTAAAAQAIGRSPVFVARRLEQGTIPSHRQGDQLRIPAAALAAWKAVMEQYRLLDV